MRKYTDTITRWGRKWLTEEETKWILTLYDDFLKLPVAKTSSGNKTRNDFYENASKKFCKRFPYRDPEHNLSWTFTKQQKELKMTPEERTRLKARIGDRLRLIRKNKDKESGVEATEDPEGETDEEEGDASIKSGPGQSTKSVDMSAGAGAAPSVPSPPATQSNDEDWGNTAPAGATADDTDTGSSGAVSDIRSLGTRYGTSEQDRLEMEQVLVDLQATTESSWAAVGEDELRQRQREMFATITGVLKVLERATGAELHAMAVWHDGTHIQACSASTERLSEFDNTSEAGLCRSTFVKYVHDTIGPAMSTAIETAAPTVYGDPDNHMRPTLPPASGFWETERNTIRLFLEYLWVWQGGLLPVPWSRLLADGQEQKYHLIEQHRLPTGAMYLEDPRLWDEETTGLWSRALRSSGGPARSTFQFRQPRPGLIENETRQIIHPDSHLTYRPESLLYMLS